MSARQHSIEDTWRYMSTISTVSIILLIQANNVNISTPAAATCCHWLCVVGRLPCNTLPCNTHRLEAKDEAIDDPA